MSTGVQTTEEVQILAIPTLFSTFLFSIEASLSCTSSTNYTAHKYFHHLPPARLKTMFRLPSRLLTSTTRTTLSSTTTTRFFSRTTAIMGVTKEIRQEGNGPVPKKGDKVSMEYTGWLKDESKPNNKGAQ